MYGAECMYCSIDECHAKFDGRRKSNKNEYGLCPVHYHPILIHRFVKGVLVMAMCTAIGAVILGNMTDIKNR